MMSTIQTTLGVRVGIVSEAEEGGDDRALDQFLASVERRAYVLAEIATGNGEEALDLVQDAMVSFVTSYRDKPDDHWRPLFHRVLQNKIRDWHRRQQVRNRWRVWLGDRDGSEPQQDGIQQAPDPTAQTPERQLALSDGADALLDAVAALPLRQQQAFMLRTWEGLDVADTARAMGCSSGSVKTHLSRAMRYLRRQLEEHW